MRGDTDQILRARLMARIAAPLLSASIKHYDGDHKNPEALAESFAQDVQRVVPIAQILVDALKPQSEAEHAQINALTAPVAAKLVAQNSDLLAMASADELTRLLKPSINVLVSFCDRDSAQSAPDTIPTGLSRGIVALSPIIGCLSHYAFGKSPAKRLTDTLDVYMRAQGDLLKALPAALRHDPDVHNALQEAAGRLFAALFEKNLAAAQDHEQDPGELFKNLLSQWTQSLSLLGVLMRHSALGEEQTSSPSTKDANQGKIRAVRARTKADDDDEESDEDDTQGSSGSGSRGAKPANNPNPMSFFVKKGA